MSPDDLTSIPGLGEKHIRALANLGIASASGLASADTGRIVEAMRRMRPAPDADEVGRWQAAARRPGGSPPWPSWERSATFVISFEVRHSGDAPERRIAAEQTELDAEQVQEVWAEWDCSEICAWMLERLAAAGAPPEEAPAAPEPAPAGGQDARGRLRVESVRLIDGDSSVEIVGGDPGAEAVEMPAAAMLAVLVRGAGAGATPLAVLRIRPAGAPGWDLGDPVAVDGKGRVELPARDLPEGVQRAQVVVWDPAVATAASAWLPPLARTSP